MSEKEIQKIIVHPVAGFDFQIVPDAVAVTIRYYVQGGGDAKSEPKSTAMQSLTIGLTAVQATEVASSLERAAKMIQARTDSRT